MMMFSTIALIIIGFSSKELVASTAAVFPWATLLKGCATEADQAQVMHTIFSSPAYTDRDRFDAYVEEILYSPVSAHEYTVDPL